MLSIIAIISYTSNVAHKDMGNCLGLYDTFAPQGSLLGGPGLLGSTLTSAPTVTMTTPVVAASGTPRNMDVG